MGHFLKYLMVKKAVEGSQELLLLYITLNALNVALLAVPGAGIRHHKLEVFRTNFTIKYSPNLKEQRLRAVVILDQVSSTKRICELFSRDEAAIGAVNAFEHVLKVAFNI